MVVNVKSSNKHTVGGSNFCGAVRSHIRIKFRVWDFSTPRRASYSLPKKLNRKDGGCRPFWLFVIPYPNVFETKIKTRKDI